MPLDLAQEFVRKIGERFGPAYEPAREPERRPARYATFRAFLEEAPLEELRATHEAIGALGDAVAQQASVIWRADPHISSLYREAKAAARQRADEIVKAIARRSPPNVRPLTAEEEAEIVARCDPSTWGRFPGQNGAE